MAENSLVKELEMSRTPIREALHKLQHEGFLKIVSNQGIMVTGMSVKKLEDLIDMRVAIESSSLTRAILLLTADDFKQIKEIVQKQKEYCENEDIYNFRKADADFHYFLLQITNNHYFLKMFNEVYELQFTASTRPVKKDQMNNLIDDHEKIIMHLENNELDLAVNILIEHLNSGKTIL